MLGKPGRPAKPTALKVLHNDRPDRINTSEPLPPEQDVARPDLVSEAGAAVWDRLAPSLITAGVLTPWDADAFAILCEALARYSAATKLVNGSALLVQGANGFVKNPALAVQADAERTFALYGARFGLTPSDRSSLKLEASGGSKPEGAARLLS